MIRWSDLTRDEKDGLQILAIEIMVRSEYVPRTATVREVHVWVGQHLDECCDVLQDSWHGWQYSREQTRGLVVGELKRWLTSDDDDCRGRSRRRGGRAGGGTAKKSMPPTIPFGQLSGELANLPRYGRWTTVPHHLARRKRVRKLGADPDGLEPSALFRGYRAYYPLFHVSNLPKTEQ